MIPELEFQEFRKIPRLSREMVVTEKIDGINGQINIVPLSLISEPFLLPPGSIEVSGYLIQAGSRTRWLAPGSDNHGFWAWVFANREQLVKLGPGCHYGEWWGSGINRGYGLPKGEKRFSLFNTSRWLSVGPGEIPGETYRCAEVPCCHVVPVLFRGEFDTAKIIETLQYLRNDGSYAAPEFMRPEGVVIYHVAGNSYWKKTLEGDAAKGTSLRSEKENENA